MENHTINHTIKHMNSKKLIFLFLPLVVIFIVSFFLASNPLRLDFLRASLLPLENDKQSQMENSVQNVQKEGDLTATQAREIELLRAQLEETQGKINDLEEKFENLSNLIKNMQLVMAQEESENKKIKEQEEEQPKEETPKAKEQPEIKICSKIPNSITAKNKIIINEVAWMGGPNSTSDEWIELKNMTGDLDLQGWQLNNDEGTIQIVFEKGDIIKNYGFYLLERTNDDSAPGAKADKIYKGSLKNEGENLYLFDENCQLQDEIEMAEGWLFGDSKSKRTLERKIGFGWQTSLPQGGTPGRENSAGFSAESFATGQSSATPAQRAIVYPKILISEIQIEGETDGKEEFVELFNPGNEDILLDGWYIQRKTKTAADYSTFAPKSLFSGKTIKAKSYFIVANASSSFVADATTTYPLTENNSLVLKNPNGDIVDKLGWGEASDFETQAAANPQAGKSLGRLWAADTQSYTDTDNNSLDFTIQSSSPRAENEPATSSAILSPAILEISTSSIVLEGEAGDSFSAQTLSLINSGESGLLFEISGLPSWISANFATGTVAGDSSFVLSFLFDVSALVEGDYKATVVIKNLENPANFREIAVLLKLFAKKD